MTENFRDSLTALKGGRFHIQNITRETAFVVFLWTFLAVHFIRWIFLFLKRFPDGYEWGEVFIKYTDGYLRRGLVGYLLYQLQSAEVIKFTWLVLCIFLIVCLFKYAYVFLSSAFNSSIATLVVFSPFYFGFFFKVSSIPGRKDILFLLLLLLIFHFIWLIVSKRISKERGFLCCMLLATASISVHEVALFLCVLPVALLVVICRPSLYRNPYFYAAVVLVVFLTCMNAIYPGTTQQRLGMERDWAELLANYKASGGMSYIGHDAKEWIQDSIRHLKNPALSSSVMLSWGLAMGPIFVLCSKCRFFRICQEFMSRWILIQILAVFFLSIFVQMILITDYGRVIVYNSILLLFFIATLVKLYKRKHPEYSLAWDPIQIQKAGFFRIFLTFFYFVVLRLKHHVASGSILLFIGS